jgi:hypothetical protein
MAGPVVVMMVLRMAQPMMLAVALTRARVLQMTLAEEPIQVRDPRMTREVGQMLAQEPMAVPMERRVSESM